MPPRISVVILAYREEPWLESAVHAVLDSRGVDVDVVLVDNGCTNGAVERVADLPRLRVVRPGTNLGFTGGCNLGAGEATGEFLAFVNSDAVVAPDALLQLAAVAASPEVGIASGSIRLADDPQRINSAGNPFHYLGLVWAGGLGDLAAEHAERVPIACASGAGMVLRRALWESLGGFADEYFAYQEDAELSLRCWQRGLRVLYVPDAVVAHHYEFTRNDQKFYLLERNRLILLLTLMQRRTLLLIAPALLVFEAAMVAVAVVRRWPRAKFAGYGWLLRNRRWVRGRRRQLQVERRCPDRELAPMWTATIDTSAVALPLGTGLFNAALAAYWAVVRRLL